MKYEDFADHVFYCVQRWVRVIIEGSETHVLEDIEYNQEGGDVAIGSDARNNPIHETTWEVINDLLADAKEVDYYRLPYLKNSILTDQYINRDRNGVE